MPLAWLVREGIKKKKREYYTIYEDILKIISIAVSSDFNFYPMSGIIMFMFIFCNFERL